MTAPDEVEEREDLDGSALDRLDATEYGDEGRPEDVAPPCEECGRRETAPETDGRLCRECADDGESDD